MDVHANFAISAVATAPSPATSGGSLVVTTGEGARFPQVPFNAVICPVNATPTPANSEVVRVTARTTDTLTITRAQEGSTARTVVVGDLIYAAITNKVLSDIEDVVNGNTEPGDNNLLAWNYDPAVGGTTSTPLGANGTCYVQKLRIDKRVSVTNLHAWVITAGATLTANQCFAGLYNGSKALVASTADQSTAWASTGGKTMALAGGPFACDPGTYYVVLMANGTTRPAFVRLASGAHNINTSGDAIRWATSNTGVTTALPGTLSTAFAVAANPYWVGLS